MIVTKVNENYEKINQSQKLLKQLNSAFINQSKEIQLVVQPLISQAVYINSSLDEIRNRLDKAPSGYKTDKNKEDEEYYIKLLKEYTDIIQQLIDTLKK